MGPERTGSKTQGQAYPPGDGGLLRLNSRVGGGQTTQPWVSPHRLTFPPRRRQSGTAAYPRWGPEQGLGPLASRDPPRARSGLIAQHSATPSLVRKSFKLAVEEWKVGNQTGSFLEGVFLSFIMVFLIIITITVVSYFIMVLILFFLPLSQQIHSFRHILWLVFPLLPDSPRHFWLGWLVKKWERGPHLSGIRGGDVGISL